MLDSMLAFSEYIKNTVNWNLNIAMREKEREKTWPRFEPAATPTPEHNDVMWINSGESQFREETRQTDASDGAISGSQRKKILTCSFSCAFNQKRICWITAPSQWCRALPDSFKTVNERLSRTPASRPTRRSAKQAVVVAVVFELPYLQCSVRPFTGKDTSSSSILSTKLNP